MNATEAVLGENERLIARDNIRNTEIRLLLARLEQSEQQLADNASTAAQVEQVERENKRLMQENQQMLATNGVNEADAIPNVNGEPKMSSKFRKLFSRNKQSNSFLSTFCNFFQVPSFYERFGIRR